MRKRALRPAAEVGPCTRPPLAQVVSTFSQVKIMYEIIGAITAAIIGGILTWYLGRRRPTHVIFDSDVLYSITLDLPETKILYRDTPLKQLYMLQLKAYNAGSRVIEKPKFVIKLQEGIRILGAHVNVVPEREGVNGQIFIKDNEVEISLNRLYPYSLNQELMILQLFSDSYLCSQQIYQIYGNGIFQDGTGWSTRYLNAQTKKIPFWHVWFYPDKKEVVYFVITLVGFVGLLAVIAISLFMNPPSSILSIVALRIWLSSFWAWLLIGSVTAFILWALAMGFRGWVLPIPIPFTNRMIRIRIVKIHQPTE